MELAALRNQPQQCTPGMAQGMDVLRKGKKTLFWSSWGSLESFEHNRVILKTSKSQWLQVNALEIILHCAALNAQRVLSNGAVERKIEKWALSSAQCVFEGSSGKFESVV